MKIDTDKRYLLDTNILLEAFLGKEPTASLMKNWIINGRIALCPVSVAEILSKATGEEKEKINILVQKFGVLSIDEKVAEIAGNYRFEFSRKAKKVYLLDCFIAAIAKKHNLILVTHNVKDYPMKDIEIIDPR